MMQAVGCTGDTYGLGTAPGGIDTQFAEQMIAYQCGVTLPRYEGTTYIALLDECGGHTNAYHFHERLSCLYEESGGHSARIGTALDGKGIYGKWEDYDNQILPKLDACGGAFGVTPDSNGEEVYHYHVQEKAPFTIGCFGPMADENGDQTLVTLEKCREIYDGCGDGDAATLTTAEQSIEYDFWCPCWDGEGSNVGNAPLTALGTDNTATTTLTGVPLMAVPTSLGGPGESPTSQSTAYPTTAPTEAPTVLPTNRPRTSPRPSPPTHPPRRLQYYLQRRLHL